MLIVRDSSSSVMSVVPRSLVFIQNGPDVPGCDVECFFIVHLCF